MELETKNKTLKEKFDGLANEDLEMKNKNKELSRKNEQLYKEQAAKCLASQVIITSLEEVIAEEEQARELGTKELDSKVNLMFMHLH